MIRKLLARIRKIVPVNYIVRNVIRSMQRSSFALRKRWPVSGTIKGHYDGIDFKIYNRCDDTQAYYYYYGMHYHEFKILGLMCAFSKRSKQIMDIGANTGLHSIIVSKKCPDIKIYAIEPYPANITRLEQNLNMNSCTNVEIKKVALGETEDTITFYVPDDNSVSDVSSAVKDHGGRIYDRVHWKKTEVPQTTLDKLSTEVGQIDFFKCDVESYEINMFRGSMNFFAANRPPFLVEISLDEDKVAFFNEFAVKFGYNIYFVGEEGLVRMDKLYDFDVWPNFLFSQYKSEHNFIPYKYMDEFVEKTLSTQHDPYKR
ncbi:MAG: FkbM family methyltransferase [Chitinophagaceae bacterium]|nr:FkbM family methyltransferase [Chitinophagaceae bacterium]